MKKLHRWPLYTLMLAFVLPILGLGGYVYMAEKDSAPSVSEVVSEPGSQEPLMAALMDSLDQDLELTEESAQTNPLSDGEEWQQYYPETSSMYIAGVMLEASIAKTWPERIKGLSGTPYLPEQVAKVFVFDAAGFHSIWMKDMRYAIDILWLDEAGKIVHIVEDARPESYPEIFTPPVPAVYVIEVSNGFVRNHSVSRDSLVTLPNLSR